MLEILTIGTELLLGSTIDTNGAWLGEQLAAAGIRVTRRTTVGDVAADITAALTDALARTGCVLCTGGLGPTADDFTKPVVAALYRAPLVLDEGWLEHVAARFRDRGIDMPPINRVQALVPAGARLFPNPRGTAPGLALESDALGTTILLPGVPSELRGLFHEHVLPFLRERFRPPHAIVSRTLRTTGIAESAIAERVADIMDRYHTEAPVSLAFLPAGIGTDLRLTCWGVHEPAAAARALDEGEALIRARLGEWIYGYERADLAAVVGERLRARGWKLALAESCTGGMIAQRITAVPGASHYFVGGFITYADEAKRAQLGVDIGASGAVSEDVALQMADGAAARMAAECALAVTGIAGPGGGTAEKPVGTVWIALRTPAGTSARRHNFGGSREEIRARAAQAALLLLLRAL